MIDGYVRAFCELSIIRWFSPTQTISLLTAIGPRVDRRVARFRSVVVDKPDGSRKTLRVWRSAPVRHHCSSMIFDGSPTLNIQPLRVFEDGKKSSGKPVACVKERRPGRFRWKCRTNSAKKKLAEISSFSRDWNRTKKNPS